MHFKKNNDLRRRGNRAISRSFFLSLKAFTNPKSSQANINQRGGPHNPSQMTSEDYVPYSSKETACFICKENLDVIIDNDDESWYFVKAKKIKISASGESGKKLAVVVHSNCLKQIELTQGQEVLELTERKEERHEVVEDREGIERIIRGISSFK
eukprot:CAMPEP_0170544618 /NCGR_PEP_ID=MMETSP0211-20121228/3308_1 /TAXON_ID=311385 /ORGANISM="Pseudokeronopsis sp., Strain OXSARD2" /LENGTH=154 /DNA_ID=CAMNT_0010848305 /DNA_START=1140 /DNA_END=1601 /DNA_ORIENTATION=+